MIKSRWFLAAGAFWTAGLLLGCSGSGSTDEGKADRAGEGAAASAGFTIRSSAFEPGQTIPKKYSYEGGGGNPPLAWSGAPAGTKEFALIVEDPDAGNPPFVHWVVYKIPASAPGLKENLGGEAKLADPAGSQQGETTRGGTGYFGPHPPPGKLHHYHFRLYALRQELDARPKMDRDGLLHAMEGKILAETELVGTYIRER